MSDKAKQEIIINKCVKISKEQDLWIARSILRNILKDVSVLNEIKEATLLTILDEIVKNILRHGKEGQLQVRVLKRGKKFGFCFVAEDLGKGINNLEKALSPGYSEDRGLGMGLNLLKALCDEVRIATLIKGGTYLEAWKWINGNRKIPTSLA